MADIKFISVQPNETGIVQKMATDIWNAHYTSIISQNQIDYMLELMYNQSVIIKEINEGVNWIFIRYGNESAGFLSFHFEAEERKVKLSKLYVYPEYHGKGIGQASLGYVITEARKIKASQVYLTVNKQNTKAIKAYLKAGFINSRSIINDIGNGFVMDDYVMVCRIEQ